MYRLNRTRKGSILFVILLLVLLILAGLVTRPKTNNEDRKVRDGRVFGFTAEPDNTIDVVVFGDSLSITSFSPMELWRMYGLTSYTCGNVEQSTVESMEMLEMFCRNQSPSVVLYEVNPLYVEIDTERIISNRAERIFPVFRYHNHWKTLELSDFYIGEHFTEKTFAKGQRPSFVVEPCQPGDYMSVNKKETRISPLNRMMLGRMEKFCRSNHISLLLYSAPSAKNWTAGRHAAVEALAEELGVPYIDMNVMTDEIPVDWQTDTYDAGDHMNYDGSVKVCRWLGKYLTDTWQISDRRNDPAFACWKDDLKDFDDYLMQLREEEDQQR